MAPEQPLAVDLVVADGLATKDQAKHYHAECPDIHGSRVIRKLREQNLRGNERRVKSPIREHLLASVVVGASR